MPGIGATLRNARVDAGIEISEIEAETKIRAKYLRALENEDWGQLPGPTYVRSFMRTYGDALGLDGRMLVEEYKLRHESLSEQDLRPIAVQRHRRPPCRRRGLPRWIVAVVLVGALVVALAWLGSQGDEPATLEVATSPAAKEQGGGGKDKPAAPAAERGERPRSVRVSVVGTGPVFVCLQDAGGVRRVDGATLAAGQRTRTFRSRRFLLRLGNGNARVLVDGRSRRVGSASPQAYRITAAGMRPIAIARSPECA